ncbi:MAG: hypothetical protein ABDH91_04410 [Bacteroidia bacterium]
MGYAELCDALWSDYQRERRMQIDRKAFEILLRVFPAVLVAQADGFTDTSEVHRLDEIVAFLCRHESVSPTELDWRAELRYLAIDAAFWRERFMKVLYAFLQENPEMYKEQAEFLYATAAASTGDIVKNLLLRLRRIEAGAGAVPELISGEERREIQRITQELHFDEAPEALAYLQALLEGKYA